MGGWLGDGGYSLEDGYYVLSSKVKSIVVAIPEPGYEIQSFCL